MLHEKLTYLRRAPRTSSSPGRFRGRSSPGFYAELIRDGNAVGSDPVARLRGRALRLGIEAEPYLVAPEPARGRSPSSGTSSSTRRTSARRARRDRRARRPQRPHHARRRVLRALPRGARRGRPPARGRRGSRPVSTVGAGDTLLAAFIAAGGGQTGRRGRDPERGRRECRLGARGGPRPLRPARRRSASGRHVASTASSRFGRTPERPRPVRREAW